MKRKILSLILVFAMTVSLLTVGTGAVEPTYGDTAGHWAESSIERWSGHGIIQGSNGQFDPNGQLTCAQLATILAKLLKLPAAKDAGFTDNTADAWYYDAINRCAAAGILNGNGDGTVTPEAPITRERAMVMLARALGIEPIRKPDLTKYTDAAQVSAYAQGYVAALIEAGIVGGVTADQLAPQANINRASTVTILDRAISTYADEAGATVKADGKGIVLVVADDVTVTGNVDKLLVPADNVDVTVSGSKNIDDITVTGDNSKVILNNSTANDVTLDGKNTELETKSGSKVENVSVTEDAKGATVNAGSGTTVKNVENSAADTTVTGSGSVKNVASDTDVTVETKGTEVKNTGDGKITVTDKNGKDSAVNSGSSSTTTGGTTSGGSSSGSSGGSSHSYVYTDNGDGTHTKSCSPCGYSVTEAHSYDAETLKCACGQFRDDVVATVDDTHGYTTLADAVAAATEGQTVKLTKNETLTARVDTNFTGTIDLGGYTISSTETCANGSVFNIQTGTVTIKNGSMVGIAGPTGQAAPYEEECDVITVRSGATANLEGLNISVNSKNGACAYAFAGGTIYVKSGIYTNSATEHVTDNESMTGMLLNQGNGTAQAIFVTGGTFCGANPASGDNSGNPSTFLAAGYQSTGSEGNWTVSCLFAGGSGTKADPFLIATATHFNNINKLESNMDAGQSYYFEQTADITAKVPVSKISGVYDGAGYKLSITAKSATNNYSYLFTDMVGHSTFKNMKVEMTDFPVAILFYADWGTAYGADFENITFNTQTPGTVLNCNVNNLGFCVINALYTSGTGTPVYNFTNITNNVSVQNESTCTGVFVGSGPCFNVKTTVNYTDCTNTGNLTGISSVGFLYGNSTYIGQGCMTETDSKINVSGCSNMGTLTATNANGVASLAPKYDGVVGQTQEQVGGNYVTGTALTADLTIKQAGDKFAVSSPVDGTSYKMVLNVGATYISKDGEVWENSDTEAVKNGQWSAVADVSNGNKFLFGIIEDDTVTGSLQTFKAYDKRTAVKEGILNQEEVTALVFNSDGYAIVVGSGTNIVIFNSNDNVYINSGVSVYLYAYDSNGTLTGTKVIKN